MRKASLSRIQQLMKTDKWIVPSVCSCLFQISCLDNSQYGPYRYCGNYYGNSLYIYGCSQLLLWFHSDGSNNYPGFNIQYNVYPGRCKLYPYALHSLCGQYIKSRFMNTSTFMHIYKNTHMHAYTYIHTCIHTYTQSFSFENRRRFENRSRWIA